VSIFSITPLFRTSITLPLLPLLNAIPTGLSAKLTVLSANPTIGFPVTKFLSTA